MRVKDYFRLGWDQLKRRKVVTALCAIGIAIGSASIIVALSFGESISYYSEQQMSQWLKIDQISVYPTNQIREDGSSEEVRITDQMLTAIRALPGVEAAAPFELLDFYSFTVDQTKTGSFDLFATELSSLEAFGYELQQYSDVQSEDTVILNYAATLDLFDERMLKAGVHLQGTSGQSSPIAYPLYQKTIELKKDIQSQDGSLRTVTYPLRVIGVMKRPEGLPDYMLRSPREAFVSLQTAERLHAFFKGEGDTNLADPQLGYTQAKVKVPDTKRIPAIENGIRLLKLNSYSNLYQQDRMGEEMFIIRLVFGGVGLFILFVASLTIIVAMTMATHQRRRQIGIMKVLGATLKQIRNMFIIESTLLGLFGGLLGMLLSYWVIWAINIVVLRFSGGGANSEILFISLWVLPIGLFFALLTGVLSGLYPAVKASRTDALTAIKRE